MRWWCGAAPAAKPWSASENASAYSACTVPLDCGAHVAPASSLRRIAPPSPAAYARVALASDTARSTGAPGTACVVNERPLSALRNT